MTTILITRWEMGKVKRWLLLSTSSLGSSRAPGARRRRRSYRQIHELHFSDDDNLFGQPSWVGSLVVGNLCPSHPLDLLLGRLVPKSRRSWWTRTTRRKPKWGRRLSPASSRSAFRSHSKVCDHTFNVTSINNNNAAMIVNNQNTNQVGEDHLAPHLSELPGAKRKLLSLHLHR